MIKPTCPKCENQSFGAIEEGVKGYIYNVIFVCCDKCGTVVGGLDYGNYLKPIGELKEKLDALQEEVKQLKGEA